MNRQIYCPRCRTELVRIIKGKGNEAHRAGYYGLCVMCGRRTDEKPRRFAFLARRDWFRPRKGDDRYGRRPPF